MASMIIQCYSQKCETHHNHSSNNTSHINVIDMDLPIKNAYFVIIVELDG